MITNKSRRREIRDLQRLLSAVGLMDTSDGIDGKWGARTQVAVLLAYTRLGWDHPVAGQWISAPALAAIASSLHQHTIAGSESPTGVGIGGSGSHIGGSGSHIGGSGSHIGGSGSHIGGSGSHIGGSGSHIGSDSTPD